MNELVHAWGVGVGDGHSLFKYGLRVSVDKSQGVEQLYYKVKALPIQAALSRQEGSLTTPATMAMNSSCSVQGGFTMYQAHAD